jgi:hypothetical protein
VFSLTGLLKPTLCDQQGCQDVDMCKIQHEEQAEVTVLRAWLWAQARVMRAWFPEHKLQETQKQKYSKMQEENM